MGVARISDDSSGLTGVLRLVDESSGMVEDRGTVEDRSPPEYGNFELAQAAIIPIASIKQPISKIFDIFTAFIPPSPSSAGPLRRNRIHRLIRL